jgi:hypothetical protein
LLHVLEAVEKGVLVENTMVDRDVEAFSRGVE